MPSGVPRRLSPEIEERLLASLASGKTLRATCREPGMPSAQLVVAVCRAYPEFAERYREAVQIGCDALADEALEIIDQTPERTPKTGVVDHAYVAWQRLRLEGRLKLLARWYPHKYAERQDLSIGNRQGETLRVQHDADTADLTVQISKALRAQKLADARDD
jgi:hypothetical protein